MNRHVHALVGVCAFGVWVSSYSVAAPSEENGDEEVARSNPSSVVDVRDAQTKLKLQRGNFVAVPIPISDPTLGTGLVAGAAYFYPQTEAQQAVQPASVTAVAGLYTSNKSYAVGVGQQSYLGWRQMALHRRGRVRRPQSRAAGSAGGWAREPSQVAD